jgi:hypothetical protein
MITFKRYFREATRDSEGQEVLDHGLKGKDFEDILIRARLVRDGQNWFRIGMSTSS